MKTSTKTLVALLLIAAAQMPAQSVPEYVNYQGLLKAANGSPLATGTYTFEFNIYDQANLGAKVWGPFLFDGNAGTGHGALVPVVNGSFNVIIGPRDTTGVSIANAFAGPNRFIEIKVNGGAPILPRQQFLSTAYALQSQSAQIAQLAQMAVQASNLVQQAADALCPPGTIVAFGGASIPVGWLLCDGRPLTNAMFPRLFAAIGTNWGNGTFDSNGVEENPPNLDTGFNLPDLRGVFLRGVNYARANFSDPDVLARTNQWRNAVGGGNTGNMVGSVQSDEFKNHHHLQNENFWIALTTDNYQVAQTLSGSHPGAPNVLNWSRHVARGGSETRPVNAYVNHIIKY